MQFLRVLVTMTPRIATGETLFYKSALAYETYFWDAPLYSLVFFPQGMQALLKIFSSSFSHLLLTPLLTYSIIL